MIKRGVYALRPRSKPSLQAIWRLQCPYCLDSSLRKPGSWFEFQEGCPRCQYRYEREDGYFTGAPWMITYPIMGISMLVIVTSFAEKLGIGSLKFISLIAGVFVVMSIGLYPYSRAIWMVFDHLIHPLQDKDKLPSKTQ